MWTTGDRSTTINRVRLHGAAGFDALSAQLRAGHAIEQVAGSVTLPAGAILCVRRLRDPRPGRVRLSALQAPPAEWARAVTESLTDLAGRAARPARGGATADAEAVIFDDRAQLLACLAIDWCRGSLASCWWWRALIGTSLDAEAVLRAWLMHPAHIAGALEEVAQRAVAAAFVARLPERQTIRLLEAVVTAHGLDRRLALTSAVERSPIDEAPAAMTAALLPSVTPAMPSEVRAARAPWRNSVPEAFAAPLRADQEQLLGVALTVRRAPAWARDRLFASALVRWREEIRARTGTPPADPIGSATAAAASASAEFGTTSLVPDTASEVGDTAAVVVSSPQLDDGPVVEAMNKFSPAVRESPPASIDLAPTEPIREERLALQIAGVAAREVETGLGGLFYLLNVALALGLYGDFTAPRGPHLEIPIWRYIALIGEMLLGGRYRRDPIWQLLADLAGPDPRPFDYAPEWRLDPGWLGAFPEARTWRWSADGDRLRVRHPAGFFILDIQQSPGQSPAQRVRREVALYRTTCPFRLIRDSDTRTRTETPLERWTRWHAMYARARLARALGVEASRAGRLLCRHPAHVRSSLTHVDVAFSLRDLPIAIRLSGLDRDPGWIPAADRIVSFRYD